MSAPHLIAVALLLTIQAVMLPLLCLALRDAHRRGMERVRRDTGGPLRGSWAVPIPSQREGRSWQ